MATQDPRRGNEPGDPNTTPGQPAETPAEADVVDSEAYGGEDDIRAGQYGPTDDFGDG